MSENAREVVGAFKDATTLETAANQLMSSGFDRARLSLIATEDAVQRELGSRLVKVEQIDDLSDLPRIAYVNHVDLVAGQSALIGGLFYFGAMAGTGAVLLSGGTLLPALAAATASGIGGGSIGALLASRMEEKTAEKISNEISHGGLILWVRTLDDEDNQRVIDIMNENGAYVVEAQAGAESPV